MVNKQPPVKRPVEQWSEETSARLRDCFKTTDWEALCSHQGSDIDSMTHCITDYIKFCVENTVLSKVIQCFHNNKLWVTSEIKALVNEKKRVFRSGDKEELHRVQKELRLMIRKGTDSYRKPEALWKNSWVVPVSKTLRSKEPNHNRPCCLDFSPDEDHGEDHPATPATSSEHTASTC